jgi:hypothetical protein
MSYDAPAAYKGTGTYGVLTEGEQTTFDEYTNLRAISDWPGFDADQDNRRADSRAWLLSRSDYLVSLANGEVPGETPGWDTADRGHRYDYLSTLNSGSPKHEVRLPCPGDATDAETVHIEEREVYLAWTSAYEAQTARKQASVDWLVTQRKKLWHLMQDDPDGNGPNDRQARYDALCVATHYGSAYESWDAAHNKWGQPYTDNTRDSIKQWLDKYVGVHESPDGSNRASRSPRRGSGASTAATACRGAPASPSARRGTTASRAAAPRACGTTPSWPRRARGSTRATRPTRAACRRAITPSSAATTPA